MDNLKTIQSFILEHAAKGAHLRLDSRQVEPGDVFFALAGQSFDGRTFIPTAEQRGASCIVSDAPAGVQVKIPVLELPELRQYLPGIASTYYNNPSDFLQGIAVTGTNGKTTVTHWISKLMSDCSIPCAILGTLGCYFADKQIPIPSLTTPDILSLEDTLNTLRSEGCKAFAMEASSIGLKQGRMQGLSLKTAVFTNLSQDHLDYHGTMQEYARAKEILFDWPTLRSAVVNIDDPVADNFCAKVENRGLQLIKYSRKQKADLYIDNLDQTSSGMKFNLHWKDQIRAVSVGFIGLFNIENFLASAGAALVSDVSFDKVCSTASQLQPPAGRMQIVPGSGRPLVVVDYAHTPDAVLKVADALEEIKQHRQGSLWIVLGAGGDRDHTKRPMMGQAAAHAEYPVLTSDNPRTEDPQTILDQVAVGAPQAVKILDRAQAIKYAVNNARPEDVVLIAGKGHEDYQEINRVRHHFSDVEQAIAALAERGERLNA